MVYGIMITSTLYIIILYIYIYYIAIAIHMHGEMYIVTCAVAAQLRTYSPLWTTQNVKEINSHVLRTIATSWNLKETYSHALRTIPKCKRDLLPINLLHPCFTHTRQCLLCTLWKWHIPQDKPVSAPLVYSTFPWIELGKTVSKRVISIFNLCNTRYHMSRHRISKLQKL